MVKYVVELELELVPGGSARTPGARTGPNRDNKVREARSRVAGRMAGVKTGCERQPTRKIRRAIQLPTPDEQVGRTPNVSGIFLSFAKRQLVDLRQDEDVVAIVAVRTVVDLPIEARRSAIIVCYGVLKGVVPIEGQPGRKTLLHRHLQRVIFVIEVVPEVTPALRPALLRANTLAQLPR